MIAPLQDFRVTTREGKVSKRSDWWDREMSVSQFHIPKGIQMKRTMKTAQQKGADVVSSVFWVVLPILGYKTPPIMPGTAVFICAMQSTFDELNQSVSQPIHGVWTSTSHLVLFRPQELHLQTVNTSARSFLHTSHHEELTITHSPHKEHNTLTAWELFAEKQVERGWEEEQLCSLLFFFTTQLTPNYHIFFWTDLNQNFMI